jgi:hypothetical protein
LILAGADPVTLRILVTKPQKKVSKDTRASPLARPGKKARMLQSSSACRQKSPCIFATARLPDGFLFLSFFSFEEWFSVEKRKASERTGP